MKKPQDSDIFGTKSLRNAPRITNDLKVNPNAQFQAKMDAQYDQYSKRVNPHYRQITKQSIDYTPVNERANFDENYHHFRKQADMKSSIFGSSEQSLENSRFSHSSRLVQRVIPKHASIDDIEYNFGRKQILKREIDKLPQNTTQIKGNGSTIFGYDQKNQNRNTNKMEKLIPYQMQWDQHDSVRYRDSEMRIQDKPLLVIQSPEQIMQSKSIVMDLTDEKAKQNNSSAQNIQVTENQKLKQTTNKDAFKKKTDPKTNKNQQKTPLEDNKNRVEIKILKGWSSNIMEDLSKYCRINGTKIVGINFEEGGKGNLILEKSKRWEVITDWLRRDAKLKIRVEN